MHGWRVRVRACLRSRKRGVLGRRAPKSLPNRARVNLDVAGSCTHNSQRLRQSICTLGTVGQYYMGQSVRGEGSPEKRTADFVSERVRNAPPSTHKVSPTVSGARDLVAHIEAAAVGMAHWQLFHV